MTGTIIPEKNYQVLSTLTRWKVISLESLRLASDYKGSREGFGRLVQRLEKKDFIKCFYQPGIPSKFLYPSTETILQLEPDRTLALNKDHLYHDAIISNTARKLLDFPTIQQVQLKHDFFSQKKFSHFLELDPDALVIGKKQNEEFTIGLEIELTQKNRKRIFEKFENYVATPYFTVALYIFDKKAVLNAYIKRLNELCSEKKSASAIEEIRSKFIFCYASEVHSAQLNLADADCYFMDGQHKLGDLISE